MKGSAAAATQHQIANKQGSKELFVMRGLVQLAVLVL